MLIRHLRTVPLHVLYAYGTDSSEEDLPPFPPLSTITGRLGASANSSGSKAFAYKSRGRGGSNRGKSTTTTPAKQPASLPRSVDNATSNKRGRKPGHTTSNADIRLKHMKKCFRAAGFQKIRFKELWKGE